MSTILRKSNRGSYQRVIYGKNAPEAQISTVDGITTLIQKDMSAEAKSKKTTPHSQNQSIKNILKHTNEREIRTQYQEKSINSKQATIDKQCSHKDGSKGTVTSSSRKVSGMEMSQPFSGLGRVL